MGFSLETEFDTIKLSCLKSKQNISTYHEYVVPKSIPITVPTSSFSFLSSLAKTDAKRHMAPRARYNLIWAFIVNYNKSGNKC